MLRATLWIFCILAGFASCHEPSVLSLRRTALTAEVHRYTAAHGSGKGIIIRIAIPAGWAEAVVFDSLDLGVQLLPCRLTDGGNVLEGNWFLPVEPPSASVDDARVPPQQATTIPDLPGLQPSFVLARKGQRRVRIAISQWKEATVDHQ